MTFIYLNATTLQDHGQEIRIWLDTVVGKENYEYRGTAVCNPVTFKTECCFWFRNKEDASMFILRWK